MRKEKPKKYLAYKNSKLYGLYLFYFVILEDELWIKNKCFERYISGLKSVLL